MHFHSCRGGGHDSIIMESSENPDDPCADGFIQFGSGKQFFDRIYMLHTLFAPVVHEVEMKFCFLQCYQIVSPEELFIDVVDKQLNCLRLLWSRSTGEREKLFEER